jgi:hypothetical protein
MKSTLGLQCPNECETVERDFKLIRYYGQHQTSHQRLNKHHVALNEQVLDDRFAQFIYTFCKALLFIFLHIQLNAGEVLWWSLLLSKVVLLGS